jgi:hypothetical protein
VYRPATNRSIGVGGHLQNALPDLRNMGFQFAWAERPECSAALPRVGTVSEFKPVRDIALASSHDQPVALFATEAASAVSPAIRPPKVSKQNIVFGLRVADSVPDRCQRGPPSCAGRRDSLGEPCQADGREAVRVPCPNPVSVVRSRLSLKEILK